MVAYFDKAISITSYLCDSLLQSSIEIKTGILTFFTSDGAYMAYKLYSLEGFERFTKAFLSELEFLVLVPRVNSIFTKCKGTFEAQRDLYYATWSFAAYAYIIEKDEAGYPIGLQLPRLKEGGIDWSILMLCLAAIFETAQFLKKYRVLEFAFYSKYVSPLGQYCYLNKIPVIQSIFDAKPKEFFIVTSSLIDFYRASQEASLLWSIPDEDRNGDWTIRKWSILFNLSTSLGKAIGIGLYRQFGGQTWMVIGGLISNHTPLFKFLLETHHRRKMRDQFPTPPEF